MATKSITQNIASNAKAIAIQTVGSQKVPQKTDLKMNIEALTALASEQNILIKGSDKRQFGYSFAEGTDENIAGINKEYKIDKPISITTAEEIYGATETYTVEYEDQEE